MTDDEINRIYVQSWYTSTGVKRDPPQPVPPMLRLLRLRDWIDDAKHENGNYFNKCGSCGHGFIGHKRRTTCYACFIDAQPAPGEQS